jgi:hypothetical protein
MVFYRFVLSVWSVRSVRRLVPAIRVGERGAGRRTVHAEVKAVMIHAGTTPELERELERHPLRLGHGNSCINPHGRPKRGFACNGTGFSNHQWLLSCSRRRGRNGRCRSPGWDHIGR